VRCGPDRLRGPGGHWRRRRPRPCRPGPGPTACP